MSRRLENTRVTSELILDDFNKVFETLKSKVNETITSVGYKR